MATPPFRFCSLCGVDERLRQGRVHSAMPCSTQRRSRIDGATLYRFIWRCGPLSEIAFANRSDASEFVKMSAKLLAKCRLSFHRKSSLAATSAKATAKQ
ncbi:hypothetical protein CVT26_000996 [Gymnopilus dilepis]|uniref:Uncharacterized protein n=1 Tax=Gymnopilus dilepis TaxID=231916 RepID=A0A409YLA8_9AGAR|nr:hypothetical protein CVT26_000996 [Gymnopilus dilepis]